MLLCYRKCQVSVIDRSIEQTGVLRCQSMPFDLVRELEWRLSPKGGSCVLNSVGTRIKINFGDFPPSDKAELIKCLQSRVAIDRQSGWDEFHGCFLVESPERARQRESNLRMLILLVFGIGVLFAVLWAIGLGVKYLILSVVNIVVAVWCARGKRPVVSDQ